MENAETAPEPILDPSLAIIDPHHHLWDYRARIVNAPPPKHPFENVSRKSPLYLMDQLLADIGSGHTVRGTVYLECGSMYRAEGPDAFKPVGETEFVNGVAAMGASGLYGDTRPCAGIVSHVDLTLGAHARDVLEAHILAAPARFRGIRHAGSWDGDPNVLGGLGASRRGPELYANSTFREGFAQLAPLNLSFDAWLLEPQIPDLTSLAQAFPDTRIVLDHVGTPLGISSYQGRRDERFDVWRANIKALAACPNVSVKLGGLAMPFAGFASFMSKPPATSQQLAEEWRLYIETCIEAFGPARAMFESNFPVDALTCDYATLWNAFKVLAAGYSDTEKHDLFFGTAARFYRLSL